MDKVPDEESILSNKTGGRNSEVSTSLIDSNNHSNGENSNEKANKKKEFDGADKGGEGKFYFVKMYSKPQIILLKKH